MKKLLFFLSFAALFVGFVACNDKEPKGKDIKLSDEYYWFEDRKIPLERLETKYYLIFPTDKTDIVVEKLRDNGAEIDESRIPEYTIKGFTTPTELSNCSYLWEVETTRPLSLEEIPELVYLAAYYKQSGGAEMGITNSFSVRPDDVRRFEAMAKKYGFTVLGRNQHDSSIYIAVCNKKTIGNSLEMANFMREAGGFSYATPEFLAEIVPTN